MPAAGCALDGRPACWILPPGSRGSGWPWLAQVADLGVSLLHAHRVASWYLVALPAVALVVMPWRPALRMPGCIVLLSVLLMRPPGPRPGEVWVDVLDVGAATAAIVSTTGPSLVFGTGETFGTRGQRFEARIARRLMAQGSAADLACSISGRHRADQHARRAGGGLRCWTRAWWCAIRAAPVRLKSRTCAARSWHWDGVRFELAPAPSGKSCVVIVDAGQAHGPVARSGGCWACGPAAACRATWTAPQVPSVRRALRDRRFRRCQHRPSASGRQVAGASCAASCRRAVNLHSHRRPGHHAL